MKEISLSRIFRWTLASFIVSFAIALIFNVGIASAESGTVTVNQDTAYINYTMVAGTEYSGAVPCATCALGRFDQIVFNITNWKRLNYVYFYGHGDLQYAHISEVTRFNIISGGSGGGTLWYSAPFDQIGFDFDAGNSYTSGYVNLSYDNNILMNVTALTGHALKQGTVGVTFPTATKPTQIRIKSNQTLLIGFYTPDDDILFSSSVNTFTTNNYVVTYPVAGKVLINVTKTDIPTKDFITSSTSTYVNETTFNANNFQFYGNYLDGLYLNVTLIGGGYNDILINSSGAPSGPVPTNTPVVNPATGKGISFDRNTYTIGDTANISWTISNSIWNSFSTQTVILKKVGLDDTTSISNVAPKTGSYLWLWTSCANPATQSVLCGYGTYQAIIYTNLLGIFETNRETAEAQVFPAQDSYILINSSVPIKTSINVTAFIGVGGVGNNGMLATYFFDPKSNDYIGESQVIGLQSGLNYRNLTFKQIGKYRVVLKNIATNQEYAAKLVDTYHTQISAPYNFSTSNITLTQTSFTFNDVMVGNYKVDSVNYSTGFPTYIDIYNLDTNSITAEFYGTGQTWDDTSKQLGNVLIRIENLPQIQGFPETKWIAGNNLIRLMLNNSVAGNSTVLSYVQFSLSTINSDGYGITVNKNKILSGESVIVTVTIPPATTANLTLVDPNGKVSSRKIIKSISFTDVLKVAGQYQYQLMNSNNAIEMSAYVTVEASPSPTTTSTVPSGSSAVSSFGSNLLSFMAMPAFWGLFIFIGAIFWVSRRRGASGDLGIVAFILANLEAVIGLWSPFTWYILIVSWVIAGIYFTVGRKAVTQN